MFQVPTWVSSMWVSGMQVYSWPLKFYFATRMHMMQHFQTWRSVDEPVTYVFSHMWSWTLSTPTSLHCSSIHCGCWKRGRGLEIGLGYKWVKPLGLAMLEQLHAESNSERSQHLSSTLKLTAGCYIASRPCSCAIFLTMHKRKQTLNSLLL